MQRLPDDRTTDQIGEKVAEVLWSYYGQQGVAGTPLAAEAAPAPVYDDSSALAHPAVPVYAEPFIAPFIAPVEVAEPVVPAEPIAPAPPVVVPVVAPPATTGVVAAAASDRFVLFERRRLSPPPQAVPAVADIPQQFVPVDAPVWPEPSHALPVEAMVAEPVRREHAVQLGFLDGSTFDLAADDPAAKALRAAAQALTLRD
jgi:hypothetical protein